MMWFQVARFRGLAAGVLDFAARLHNRATTTLHD